MNSTTKTALMLAAGGLGLWYVSRARGQATYSFANKVVWITGGSRGLGLVLARQLTREGARVAICARNQGELERAAEDLTAVGSAPRTDVVDVTDASQVAKAAAAIEAACGPIDVLINNAGMICVGPLSTTTREDFTASLAVHFWGAYNAIDAVLPGMRQRREGRIVNISSIGGKIGVPHLTPYCVGKFALVGYSQGLRAELALDDIVVTTVCPGLMRTGSPRNALFKGQHNAEHAAFKVSGSLPLITIDAEAAANQVVEACRRGDAELVISLPAKFGVALNALFPELVASLVSSVNRFLPGGDGTASPAIPGKDCDFPAILAPLTTLTDRAALQNNEIDPTDVDGAEAHVL